MRELLTSYNWQVNPEVFWEKSTCKPATTSQIQVDPVTVLALGTNGTAKTNNNKTKIKKEGGLIESIYHQQNKTSEHFQPR